MNQDSSLIFNQVKAGEEGPTKDIEEIKTMRLRARGQMIIDKITKTEIIKDSIKIEAITTKIRTPTIRTQRKSTIMKIIKRRANIMKMISSIKGNTMTKIIIKIKEGEGEEEEMIKAKIMAIKINTKIMKEMTKLATSLTIKNMTIKIKRSLVKMNLAMEKIKSILKRNSLRIITITQNKALVCLEI